MHCSLLPTVLRYKAISKWKEMITIKYATNPAKLCISLLFPSSFIIHGSGPLRARSLLYCWILAWIPCVLFCGDSERFVSTRRLPTPPTGFNPNPKTTLIGMCISCFSSQVLDNRVQTTSVCDCGTAHTHWWLWRGFRCFEGLNLHMETRLKHPTPPTPSCSLIQRRNDCSNETAS